MLTKTRWMACWPFCLVLNGWCSGRRASYHLHISIGSWTDETGLTWGLVSPVKCINSQSGVSGSSWLQLLIHQTPGRHCLCPPAGFLLNPDGSLTPVEMLALHAPHFQVLTNSPTLDVRSFRVMTYTLEGTLSSPAGLSLLALTGCSWLMMTLVVLQVASLVSLLIMTVLGAGTALPRATQAPPWP